MTKFRVILKYLFILLVGVGLIQYVFGRNESEFKEKPIQDITSTQFSKYLNDEQIQEVSVVNVLGNDTVKQYNITLKNGDKATLLRDSNIYVQDSKTFERMNVVYKEQIVSQQSRGTLGLIFDIFIQILIFGGIFLLINFIFARQMGKQQGSMFNMNKKFQVLDLTNHSTKDSKTYSATLEQVIGLPKNTRKQISNLTTTIQKIVSGQAIGDLKLTGLLLYGPPGTGKSLIAKAIATSVKSYFIHISGADFVDKFVGQGAANINELFKVARETSLKFKAPVIIFIDEIDAVGGKRDDGANGGGNDERKQTVDALLHHLSGVESEAQVFVIGATNHKNSLDEALVRSGRLSTHIEIPIPDKDARKELFDFYLAKIPSDIKLDSNIDTSILAEYAVNMTGADISELIENIKHQANGENKTHFDLDDLIELIEVKMYGTIREELMNNEKTLKETAYHEAGHALLALRYFPKNVLKACVTPRDKALGYVAHNIMDNRVSLFKNESKHYIQLTLAGHVAEKLIFNDTTSGVSNDLEQANSFARNLVQHYGAGETLLIKPKEQFKEGISNNTMYEQEKEMVKILDECYKDTTSFLEKNVDLLHKFASLLLSKKILNKNDLNSFYQENMNELSI